MDLCVYSGHCNMVQFLKLSVINIFVFFISDGGNIPSKPGAARGERLTLSASCCRCGGGHATYHSFGIRHCPDDGNWIESAIYLN